MKTLHLFTYILFLCVCFNWLAQGETNFIERTNLSSRVYSTWEGPYKFTGKNVVKICGMQDLYVLIYRNPKSEGVLVDYAIPQDESKLNILIAADPNLKGIVPILDGVDVFPDNGEAEIIVRWSHPGNGGFRSVEKYQYTGDSLVLIERSEFTNLGPNKVGWISEKDFKRRGEEREKVFSSSALSAPTNTPNTKK